MDDHTPTGDLFNLFDSPPVVESWFGVQFSPLLGIQSGHFGLLWSSVFGGDWFLGEDRTPLPKISERFGSKQLNAVEEVAESWPQVRMTLRNDDGRSVQFQANRVICAANNRKLPGRESNLRARLMDAFAHVERFAEVEDLGKPVADAWEVNYLCSIPQGDLWQKPADWHRIFPALFPATASVAGFAWGTFDGRWYFELPDKAGRVRVEIKKVVVNQTDEIVIWCLVTARGEVAALSTGDWVAGLDLGVKAATQVFTELASDEAKKAWGAKS